MRTLISLSKATVIAALIFAVAWIRWPITSSTFRLVLDFFAGYGLMLAIFSMVVGLPLVLVIERCRIGRWWSYTLVAAATGAYLAWGFGRRPVPMSEVRNPHGGFIFSPWTRDSPIIDSFNFSTNDYIGSIAFCTIVGGSLGFAFWYFYSRSPRPNKGLERP